MNNPFNPSFGKDPNSPYQTTLIYGVRGVGKTSLLTDIGNKMSAKKNWLVVNLATNYNVLQTLIDSICQKSSPEIKKLLDKIEGIKLSAFGIQFEYRLQELTETNYSKIFWINYKLKIFHCWSPLMKSIQHPRSKISSRYISY